MKSLKLYTAIAFDSGGVAISLADESVYESGRTGKSTVGDTGTDLDGFSCRLHGEMGNKSLLGNGYLGNGLFLVFVFVAGNSCTKHEDGSSE